MFKKILGKSGITPKSYIEIKQEWQKIQSLDIKSRFKLLRAIAHDICAISTKNSDLEQLEFYIDVLKQINQVHDIPRCKRSLSKMTATWLDLTGSANAKIIKKIAGKINLETGCIAISDTHYFDLNSSCIEKNLLNLMNEGKSYIFHTGTDGFHNVQVRIVDSVEPVLSTKEFNCVENVTQTAVIHIPTGQIIVADFSFFNEENESIRVNVEPGNYKLCVFYIRSKKESFYIVLCKVDQEVKNNLLKLPEFN